MEDKQKLDAFGEKLVNEVRDKTITQFEKVLSGTGNGKYFDFYRKNLSSFSSSQLEIIEMIISDVVDSSIHNFLWMFEQTDDFKICTMDNNIQKLDELSDGLSGELYSDNGWIVKYSSREKSLVDKIIDENN